MSWLSVFVTLAVGASQIATVQVSSSDRQEIVFGLIIGNKGSSRAIVGVQDAVNEINNRLDILPNYRLRYIPLSIDSNVLM